MGGRVLFGLGDEWVPWGGEMVGGGGGAMGW